MFGTLKAYAGWIWGAQQRCTRTALMPQKYLEAAEQLGVSLLGSEFSLSDLLKHQFL